MKMTKPEKKLPRKMRMLKRKKQQKKRRRGMLKQLRKKTRPFSENKAPTHKSYKQREYILRD
jgi:hypothetical protein